MSYPHCTIAQLSNPKDNKEIPGTITLHFLFCCCR